MTQNRRNYILLSIIAHYLFFPFYFGFIPNAVQQLIIFGFFAGFAFFKPEIVKPLFTKLGRYRTPLIIGAVCYTVMVGSAFIIPFLYGTRDFSYFSTHVRQLLFLFRYIIFLAMVRAYLKPHSLKDTLLKMFVEATRHYVVFTMLLLLIHPFRDFWISIIHETQSRLELLTSPMYFARIGWAGYSGFSATYFCTLAALFALYLILKEMKNKRPIPKQHVVSLLFALIGNSFYGRAGLLTSLVLIGCSVIYMAIVYKKVHYAALLIGGVLGVFFFLTFLQQFNATLANWYDWMMQPIRSILESGTIQTSSTDILWGMWFVPEPDMILFGNGFYTSPLTGNYYFRTDVGFLRPLLFFGLFFTILLFIVPFILMGKMAKESRLDAFFVFMMTVAFILFEIKAEVVQLLIPLLFLLYLAQFVERYKTKEQKHDLYSKVNQSEVVVKGLS